MSLAVRRDDDNAPVPNASTTLTATSKKMTTMADDLVEGGAATALTSALNLELLRGVNSGGVTRTLRSLRTLYSDCNPESAESSLSYVAPDLIPASFLVLEVGYRMEGRGGDHVRAAADLLKDLSSRFAPDLRLVRRRDEVLRFLIGVVEGGSSGGGGAVGDDVVIVGFGGASGRPSVTAAASLLSSFTRNGRNALTMARFPGMLDCLSRTSSGVRPSCVVGRRARGEATAALASLSRDPLCKSVLAGHGGCRGAMEAALNSSPSHSSPPSSSTAAKRVKAARRRVARAREERTLQAAECVRRLSAAAECRIPLVEHGGGTLVDALLLVVASDPDCRGDGDKDGDRTALPWISSSADRASAARASAAVALANLASGRGTARAVGGRPGSLRTLSTAASNSRNGEVAGAAAAAVVKMSAHLRRGDRSHPRLLEALVRMSSSAPPSSPSSSSSSSSPKSSSLSPSGRSLSLSSSFSKPRGVGGGEQHRHPAVTESVLCWAARGMARQSLKRENRPVMAKFRGLVGSLLYLAQRESANREISISALEALGALAMHGRSARSIAGNFIVLRALVDMSSSSSAEEGDGDEDGSPNCREEEDDGDGDAMGWTAHSPTRRKLAIKAILSLATHGSISERIARERGLVASLSRYGSSDDHDVELRRAATHGVLLLAPLL